MENNKKNRCNFNHSIKATDTKRNFDATSTRNRIMASTMSVDEYFDERKFLKSMMTVEGAIRYANNMREEIKTLAFYADLYGKSTSMTLRQIHPEARRMVSHNRKWMYVYHIEASFVIVDRIIPAKMNKG